MEKQTKIKFKRTLTSRATIKKSETYDFDKEFTPEEMLKGREYRYDCPLFLNKDNCWYALYRDDKEETILCIVMFHSFDKFKELNTTDGIPPKPKVLDTSPYCRRGINAPTSF